VCEHAAQLALIEDVQDAVVKQTAACSGLRPIPNAFGVAVGL
jgi:hypothetical protein